MSSLGYERAKAAKGAAPKPYRSGFCGRGNPPTSHERCPGAYRERPCVCDCHVVVEVPNATAPELPLTFTSQPVAATSITTPGLVYGMDDETYHGDPVPGGSLSSTFARLLTNHVPAKAKELRTRKPTKAMNLGKAAHARALGAGPQLIVWEHDGRTKDGKAERAEHAEILATEAAVAVTAAERDQILGMAAVLNAEPAVQKILTESQSEVSGFWQEAGIWLRARYDLLSDQSTYDYKTCQDSTRRGFSLAMGRYGYHQQAELYRRGLIALGHPAGREPLRFICQETTAPYLVQIHTPDVLAIEVARELNDRAIGLYTECVAAGNWPAHEHLVAEPATLPAFYFYDLDDVLPDHWRAANSEMEIA